MKKLFLLALFLPVSAFAADLPAKAPSYAAPIAMPVNWTGFYAGINGGGGWSPNDESLTGGNSIGAAAIASGFVPNSIATRGGGALVGGQVGYNYQVNNFVLGPEFDIDYAHIGGAGSQALALGPFSLTSQASTRLNWLATLRARAGYLVTPDLLVYATGGGAVGHVDNTTSITLSGPGPFNGSASADGSATKWGWVAGGGVEYQFAPRWSVKSEYKYVDLGGIDTSLGATVLRTPVAFNARQDLHYHTFEIGLNYRFYP